VQKNFLEKQKCRCLLRPSNFQILESGERISVNMSTKTQQVMLLSKDMGWGRPPLWPLLEGVGGAQLIPRKSDLLLFRQLI
jgi:hypothetical protein